VAIDRLQRKKKLSSDDSDRGSDYSLQSPSLRKTKKKNANRKGPKRSKYQKRLDRQSQNVYRQGKTTEEGVKQSSGTLENAYKPKCPRCFRIFSSLLAFQYHDIRLVGSAMWILNLDPRGDNFVRSGCAFITVVPGYQKMLRCRAGSRKVIGPSQSGSGS
jgi:hypothetical protein